MNAGLIASRYANALMRYAQEKGVEDRLYEEAGSLRRAFGKDEEVQACIAGLSEPMQKFLSLVIRNKRVEFLTEILRVFRIGYRKEKGITQALLTTAAEEPALAGKLRTLMQAQGFTQVDFKTEVNPELIGGFVLRVEDKRLDASIATQLRTIRKEWEEKNRKLRNNG